MMSNNFYIIINSLSKGGAERIATDIGFYLEGKGYCPIYLLLDDAEVEYEIARAAKVEHLPLAKFCRGSLFLFVLFFQALYVRIKYRRERYFLSFLHRGNLVNGLSAIFSSRKVVISERSIFSKSYYGKKKAIMRWLLYLLFKRVDCCVAISSVVKDELQSVFGLPSNVIKVINNPVNAELFRSRVCRSKSSAKKFCYVGRLVRSKRVELAISLFQILLSYYPGSSLSIAGGGPDLERVKSIAASKGVSGSVVFLGSIDDVAGLMSSSDYLIFMSEYESFGNVALEALSCALPVIYSDNLLTFPEIFGENKQLSFAVDVLFSDASIRELVGYIDNFDMSSYLYEREARLPKFTRDVAYANYLEQVII
jgi:glycosyltransferase involved in cell wall biosynthesis